MTKITLITDTQTLGKESNLLANSLKRSDSRVQAYLVSEIAHIEEHRNPTRLNQFFTSIKRSGARVNAMHNFIQAFGNVTLVTDAKDKEGKSIPAHYQVKGKSNSGADRLEKAMGTSWTTFRPETAPVQYDVEARAESFLFAAYKAGCTTKQIQAAIAKMDKAANDKASEAIAKAKERAAKAKKEATDNKQAA